MTAGLIFDPLLGWTVLQVLAALAVAALALAFWRGLAGAWLRALTAAAVLLALANPSLQEEERADLSDSVIVVVDDSASQRIADRPDQTADALARVEAAIAALPNTEARVIRVGDGEGDSGTLLMAGLAEAMAEVPRARLAGAILISDGQAHAPDRICNCRSAHA